MNIKEKFLQLTSSTYPHGKEYKLFKFMPDNLFIDEWGNLHLEIDFYSGRKPSCMFCCHLDTYGHYEEDVKHVISGNIIRTDETTILGADDKAGVVILLNMIENSIPGLYYFFLGEEIGTLGSKKYIKNSPVISNIKKVISFDKRGDNSIATHMRGKRSCSDEFAINFAKNLNKFGFDYTLDKNAGSSDSINFIDIYPECTNISVGYHNEHTDYEYQDMDHLIRLCKATTKINWEELLVVRDIATYEKELAYGMW